MFTPLHKTLVVKAIAICILLILVTKQSNEQSKVPGTKHPPQKVQNTKRSPALVHLPKKINALDACANTGPYYVNDNSQVGDVYTTAVGDDVNCGTSDAPFATVQHAFTVAQPGDIIYVDAGEYDEDISMNQSVNLVGAGASLTTIKGPIGGPGSTIAVVANNVDISGFTITRDGNNVVDWNNSGLNSAGLSVAAGITGMVIHDNIITQNRTAIDVNNSSGHTIRNNIITDNHTGLIFRNATNNNTVTENVITNNRTVGVLFLDASGGSNVPQQTALNCIFNNNNISSNWYGQIVDRQSGGSLPTPGTTNLKNFSSNWYGTNQPVVTTANSGEPGYALLIPTEFGGTATAPGGQPDIAGPASANFDYTPYLNVGADVNTETTPGRGTFGFQGNFTNLWVTASGSQTGSSGRINEGIGLVAGNILNVTSGAFNENVSINKSLTLKGANYNVSCPDGRSAESVINGVLASGTPTISVDANDVTINGFTISNPLGSFGIYAKGRNNNKIQNNIITNVGNAVNGSQSSYGIAIEMGNAANTSGVTISKNCINNIRGGTNTSLTGNPAKSNNGSGVAIGVGFSTASHDISNLTISNNIIDHTTASTAAFADGGKGAYGVLIDVGASGAASGKAVNPLITNNSITVLEGLWAHGIGLEGETPDAIVSNNYIDNLVDHKGNTDAIGVLLEDNDGAVSVSIHSNSFTAMAFGIVNTMAPTVDASCNWYGSNNAATVAAKIYGPVTYVPFLFSGTDANTNATGFQPVSSCSLPFSVVLNSTNDVSCNGDKTGAIDITVSGGSGNYKFLWSNNKKTEDLSGIAAGTYTVTVTDKKYGNTATLSAEIMQPSPLTLTVSNKTDVPCYGYTTGSFSVTAGGGTPGYQYSIDGSEFTNQTTYTNLAAGSYNVVVKDDKGCTKVVNVIINGPANAFAVVVESYSDIRCHGNSTGKIKLSSSGGTKPYTSNYTLTGTTITGDPLSQSNSNGSFKNLPAGTYDITRTDANGCSSTTHQDLSEPASGCNPLTSDITDSKVSTIGSLDAVLSPNPAISEFTLLIKSNNNSVVTLRIVNMLGKVVYNKQVAPNQSYRFGQQFANGVYSVQIIQGTTVKTIKAIKGK